MHKQVAQHIFWLYTHRLVSTPSALHSYRKLTIDFILFLMTYLGSTLVLNFTQMELNDLVKIGPNGQRQHDTELFMELFAWILFVIAFIIHLFIIFLKAIVVYAWPEHHHVFDIRQWMFHVKRRWRHWQGEQLQTQAMNAIGSVTTFIQIDKWTKSI